jgi:hypothetical protein
VPIAASAAAIVLAVATVTIVAYSLRHQELDEIRRVMALVDSLDAENGQP